MASLSSPLQAMDLENNKPGLAVNRTANGVAKRVQTEWKPFLKTNEKEQLRLLNSFTRKKEDFLPIEGNQVKFYICGPTVYDSAHMGHARAYLSFDIVRRVLQSYFNYDVLYVMNITDIDDKIIKRARQGYLFEQYKKSPKDFERVHKDVILALEAFGAKAAKETDKDKQKMLNEMALKVNEAVKQMEKDVKSSQGKALSPEQLSSFLDSVKDILSEWLDAELGDTVTELGVFSDLARKFENDFLQDMCALNVKRPDVLTRVSEYIPEIINYVKTIVDNGYGYVTKDGSVYFDTQAFADSPNHHYAKLVPEAFGDTENAQKHLREGEGELSIGSDKLVEKRSMNDFALWKSSKVGEPYWSSPWGQGRPGWHIECSAMSSAVCGDTLDIHAGGFDLKFPHHDNEIAQCEAFFDSECWVNYFLHCGTLRIQGAKMSKSLKNFITIKKALESYTARQLRILFLMHNWTDVLDYSNATMEHTLHYERMLSEFFLTVKDLIRQSAAVSADESAGFQKYEEAELTVLAQYSNVRKAIHAALCDSVDTRTVLEQVRNVVSICNLYMKDKVRQSSRIIVQETAGVPPNINLLRNIAEYVTWLFKMFGAIPETEQLGFQSETSSCVDLEEKVMPYLDALAEFREVVRGIARTAKANDILKECDRLRDEVLPELGVRLEDKSNRTCMKLVDRETLLREMEQKKALEAAKEAEKERKRLEKAQKEQEKEAAKRIPPSEMFKQGPHAGKFKEYDENGIPTVAEDGQEVSKKQRKKFEKLWEEQKKTFESSTS